MKKHSKKFFVFALFFISVVIGIFVVQGDYLSPDYLRMHRSSIMVFIQHHYLPAVLIFMLLYLLTALFLPGALALSIAGGMMFGIWQAIIYINIGATAGAVLAFYAARFVIGDWVQEHFKNQLDRFNSEIDRHGHNYLLVLRILPVFPFFVVNYCAGITKISFHTFLWTTSLGMLPGSIIYAFIGHEMGNIDSFSGLLSLKIILPLLLLSLFPLLPVIIHHRKSWRKKNKHCLKIN